MTSFNNPADPESNTCAVEGCEIPTFYTRGKLCWLHMEEAEEDAAEHKQEQMLIEKHFGKES